MAQARGGHERNSNPASVRYEFLGAVALEVEQRGQVGAVDLGVRLRRNDRWIAATLASGLFVTSLWSGDRMAVDFLPPLC